MRRSLSACCGLLALSLPAQAQTYADALAKRAIATHPGLESIAIEAAPKVKATAGQSASGAVTRKLALNDVSGDRVGDITLAFKTPAMADAQAKTIAAEIGRRVAHLENLTQPWPFDPELAGNTIAQTLVDETLAAHPEVIILMMHANRPGTQDNVVIASNIGRIGKKADEDDMRVIKTEKPNLEVGEKGNRFETELVLRDSAGANIGALGVVYAYKKSDDKEALAKRATALRDALARRIPDSATLFAPAALEVLGRTALPATYTGDFDHFAVDLNGNRLFLAAEDHGTLEAFDLATSKHLKTFKGVETPHSLFYLPDTNRLIETDSGKKGAVRLFDGPTYAPKGSYALTAGGDSAGLDRSTGRLYVVTGGKDAGMNESFLEQVDPATGKVGAKYRFDVPKVEAMAFEQKGNRLFINVTAKNAVFVFDKTNLTLLDTWPVTEAEQNAPMAFDEANHRLFIVTRKPGMAIVKDSETGKTIASFKAPERCDEVVFDAANHSFYALGGEGTIGVYREAGDKIEELPRIPSEAGAKTGILVPELHRLYVAVSPGEGKSGAAILSFATN